MRLSKETYQKYIDILNEELIPAEGCTEPIAIAYTAAVAAKTLGTLPDKIEVLASGNLIKNAMGVFIPNGEDLKGVGASAIMGAVGGDPDKKLEVLSGMKKEQLSKVKELLASNFCSVSVMDGDASLHLIIKAYKGDQSVSVELIHTHTNIVCIKKNDVTIFEKSDMEGFIYDGMTARTCLNIDDIYEFANTCNLDDVRPIITDQINCNLKIAEEGLVGNWGLGIGKMLLANKDKCRAYAAAASDARMNGCTLPVVIVSGSGNQGATASLPVIIYAREIKASQDTLYRALILSNLITIHQKTGIGRLSAYCGVVSAAVGSGSAMTYLDGGTLKQIKDTITNTIANISGMICDGAKSSCAAKIATSLDAAILGHKLAMNSCAFEEHTGIVKGDVEDTIATVGRIASKGMTQTDREILYSMTQKA